MAVSHTLIDRRLGAGPIDHPVRAEIRLAPHPGADWTGRPVFTPGRTGRRPRRGEVRRALLPLHDVARTIEEIARETAAPKWFQLYVLRDRELTRSFIERARASNCTALVLTVDTKVQGPRERDMRNGFTVPPRFTAATILDFAWHCS